MLFKILKKNSHGAYRRGGGRYKKKLKVNCMGISKAILLKSISLFLGDTLKHVLNYQLFEVHIRLSLAKIQVIFPSRRKEFMRMPCKEM